MLGFFGGFNSHKLKSNLKMASQRITLVNNKMDNMVKRRKKDIAKLLESGKEEKARILVEHVIRDDFTMEAHELIELLCETCVARLSLLCAEKQCPFDMVQTVSTLIYVARRVQIPELIEIRKQLIKKYGKEFAQRAERNVDSCVNERIIQKLSVQPPNAFLVVNYLKSIAEQYGVVWEPTETPMDASSAMKPPTGFSVKPAPATGFENLYTPSTDGAKPAMSVPSTKVSDSRSDLPHVAPIAPTTGGTGAMVPPQFDSLDKNGDGVLTRDEFNGDLKIPGGADDALPIAPVVGDTESDLLPMPPHGPSGDGNSTGLPPPPPTTSTTDTSTGPTAPSTTGSSDMPDFSDLQARFNALSKDD